METLKPFRYVRPKALDDVLALLKTHGEKAALLAGGTDLLVMMKERVVAPEILIDIKSIDELNHVTCDEKGCVCIGALTTISNLIKSELIRDKYTALLEAAKSLGTPQVRNMATIGGNICRTSPCADTIPPLMAFDAQVRLVGSEGERMLLLEEFITGPGTNQLTDEILVEVRIAADNRGYRSAYKKIGRLSEDLAKASCAVKIVVTDKKIEDIRIVLGAVGPTAIRARQMEKLLKGKKPSFEQIQTASETIVEDIDPITDVRSSAQYRSHVSKEMAKRLVDHLINNSKEV